MSGCRRRTRARLPARRSLPPLDARWPGWIDGPPAATVGGDAVFPLTRSDEELPALAHDG